MQFTQFWNAFSTHSMRIPWRMALLKDRLCLPSFSWQSKHIIRDRGSPSGKQRALGIIAFRNQANDPGSREIRLRQQSVKCKMRS